MTYVIGINASTTATKALVIDGDGRVVGSAVASYDYETPHPRWSEQDPDLWWDATTTAVPGRVSATRLRSP